VYSLAQELMINLGTWQPPNDDAPQLAAEGDEAATAEEGEEEAAARPKPSIKMCGIAAVLLHNYKTQGVLKSPIRAARRARSPAAASRQPAALERRRGACGAHRVSAACCSREAPRSLRSASPPRVAGPTRRGRGAEPTPPVLS